MTCPECGAVAAPDERFCESCGAQLDGAAGLAAAGASAASRADGTPGAADGLAGPRAEAALEPPDVHEGTLLDDVSNDATDAARYSPIHSSDTDLSTVPATCASCSGPVADDGYCEQCGAAAPRRRDHWLDAPASWLVAVCDRGVRHSRNEDATAVAAAAQPSSLGAMVVCDGVSMAPGSDVASLAAARAARDAMVTGLRLSPPAGAGGGVGAGAGRGGTAQQTARAGELAARILAGGAAAQEQAAAAGRDVPAAKSPPSCTFVAALIERGATDVPGVMVAGWVGDSRAYWLPDGAPGMQISQDDSWAAEAMAQGVPRAEAETMPQSHAITRWLGADAPDPVPHTAVVALDRPGWVLLCSDGLWNYCSEPTALSDLVARTWVGLGADADPAALAEALTAWAIEQGGHDNITVALARFEPVPTAAPDAAEAIAAGAVDQPGEDEHVPEQPEQAGV